MARRYAFLRFRAGVDYQHVNPTLLARVNRLGMFLGKIITITSGARTTENNTGATGSHHIPSSNPSGMGEAVDAYIGGKQIGSVVKEPTLKRFGLYSGNRPGFYKGKPDPMHLETLERRTGQSPKGMPADSPAQAQPVEPAQVAGGPSDTSLPQVEPAQIPAGPPPPEASQPTAYAPGSVPADGSVSQDPAETWRVIAAQPLASDETRLFVSRLGG